MLGTVILNDGLGTHATVLREVENHAYGETRRWAIDIMERGRRAVPGRGIAIPAKRAGQPRNSQVNDSQILEWLTPIPEKKKRFFGKPASRSKVRKTKKKDEEVKVDVMQEMLNRMSKYLNS